MLETVIQENTAAVRAMSELLAKFMATSATSLKVEAPKSVKAEKPAPTLTAPPTTTATESAPAQTEPAVASPSEVTYADVSTAVLAKMKTDKAAVMTAAAKFGVKNAKELKQEQWADFIKEIA